MNQLHSKNLSRAKAIFLDRDGIINKDSAYPHLPEHIIFKEDIFDFCQRAQQRDFLLIVVTNQAGVAKGYFSEEAVVNLHTWMNNQFRDRGITIAKFYFCPFHKNGKIDQYRKDSFFRKPQPGMILQAAKEFDIDITASIMIGDKHSDRINLPNLKSIVVKSKYTGEDFDVEKLSDCWQFIN